MTIVQPSPDLGERLGTLRLPDADRKLTALGSLWAHKTVILIHLNSFASLISTEQVTKLLEELPDLDALELELVAVGSGDPKAAADFRNKFTRRFPILVDGALRSFEAIGEGHRKSAMRSSPSNLLKQVKVLRNNAIESASGKHPKALGATHVIRAGGEVTFAWLNDEASGVCPVEEVLAAAAEEPWQGLQYASEEDPG